MVRIAWAMLRRRPAAVLATFLALCCAVVATVACGAMLESGIRFHGLTARYAAAPILVATTDVTITHGSGDDREVDHLALAERAPLPSGLAERIATLPGVRAVVSDVTVPAQLGPGRGAATGTDPVAVEAHPWSAAPLAPFTLRAGAAPTASNEVIIEARLADELHVRVGQPVELGLSTGAPRAFTVSGIVVASGRSPQAPTVFLSDAVADAAAGRPADVIAVRPDAGASRGALAAAVKRVLPARADGASGAYPRVYTGADRGSVESTDVEAGRVLAIAVSASFGGCALLIALIVVAGTVGLSVRLRHRDIALLRAIAATPRQVRRMVVRETAAVAVVAAAAGIGPGLAAARWLRDQFVARQMVPASFQLHQAGLPVLIGAAAALVMACGAAWVASFRPSRVGPSAALAETAVDRTRIGPVRIAAGLIALAGGITLSAVSARAIGDTAASISVGTVFSLVVAVGLLGPLLIRVVALVLGVGLRWCGVTGRLAAANLSSSAGRLAGVMTSLVLVVGLGGSLWFVQSSEVHAAKQQTSAGLLADYVVTSTAPGLPPQVLAAVRSTPGVAAATAVVQGTVLSARDDGTTYSAQGVDPARTADLGRTVDLDVTAGRLADLAGNDTVALDSLTAQALHLRVGGRFDGWFGDGATARLRVVAIYQRGLGFAPITVDRQVLLAHVPAGRDEAIYVSSVSPVSPVSSVSSGDLAATLRSELARLAPGASVVTRDGYRVGLDEDMAQNAWTNQLITLVLLAYVVIAALNTLIMYALGRRREIALLRLTGTTRRQIRRMVGLEQSVLLGLTLAIGAAIAAATLIPMVKGLTGSSTPYIPLPGWVVVIGGVLVLGRVAVVVPVRRILRGRPIDAIGVRE